MTEWVESCGVTQIQCELCGARKKEKVGVGVGVGVVGARKRGGKRTDRGRDTSPVCLMWGFPGVFEQ